MLSSALCACAGRREWPAFRDWFADSLTPALNAWMGSVEVVYEGKAALDPERRYVFGYAPHGLFPIGVHNLLLCSLKGVLASFYPLCMPAANQQSRNYASCYFLLLECVRLAEQRLVSSIVVHHVHLQNVSKTGRSWAHIFKSAH